MKWEVGDAKWQKLFGECQHTVFRGMHLVMTAGQDGTYVIQESATRKELCRFPQKGQCYTWLKQNYRKKVRQAS